MPMPVAFEEMHTVTLLYEANMYKCSFSTLLLDLLDFKVPGAVYPRYPILFIRTYRPERLVTDPSQ